MVDGDTVVVMARAPSRGQVKTRLAQAIGEESALAIYRAFLRDIDAQLRDGPWRLVWAVHPPGGTLAADVAPATRIDQRGDDLAARMRHAFADLRAAGAVRLVMVGTDAPHLGRAAVESAFAGLRSAEVVLLPARDGGYCLIGMRVDADLFSGIEMSTPSVCRQTIARAKELGLACQLMSESFDVDERRDLDDLAARIERGEIDLPHTAAVLRGVRG